MLFEISCLPLMMRRKWIQNRIQVFYDFNIGLHATQVAAMLPLWCFLSKFNDVAQKHCMCIDPRQKIFEYVYVSVQMYKTRYVRIDLFLFKYRGGNEGWKMSSGFGFSQYLLSNLDVWCWNIFTKVKFIPTAITQTNAKNQFKNHSSRVIATVQVPLNIKHAKTELPHINIWLIFPRINSQKGNHVYLKV